MPLLPIWLSKLCVSNSMRSRCSASSIAAAAPAGMASNRIAQYRALTESPPQNGRIVTQRVAG